MTVEELIKELQQLDPDSELFHEEKTPNGVRTYVSVTPVEIGPEMVKFVWTEAIQDVSIESIRLHKRDLMLKRGIR